MKPLCRHWHRPELVSKIEWLGWRPCLHCALNMIFLGLERAVAFMTVLWRVGKDEAYRKSSDYPGPLKTGINN